MTGWLCGELVRSKKYEVRSLKLERIGDERMKNKKGYRVDQVLDCRRLSCPMPVLKTKNAIGKMGIGEILEVISTDPGSVKDIPAWTSRMGQELLEMSHEDSCYRFFIKKLK